mmetsp:Transcript_10384/g.23464  ORF Transcript_10384/g.23464 Transcript_10384/m.23464 type:complete len:603 (+) Transcript_10384:106-1914(+)
MALETFGFTKTVQRTFHDTLYEVTVAGDGESLCVGVEHVEDGRRWRAKFAAPFIEEITQRTGNAKTFDVFVKMALSALMQESDSVYLDVLTARDLDMLRRHANPQGPPTTSGAGQSDKRYVILTYCAEFDKVHYPLPLPLETRSEEETLKKLVSRLRSELAEARNTIMALEKAKPPVAAGSYAEADPRRMATLEQRNAELTDALRAARREADQARAELRAVKASPAAGGGQAHPGAVSELQKLRDTCARLQAELKSRQDEARQHPLALKRVSEQAARDLRAERQKVDRLERQVRKLEDEKRALSSRLPAVRPGDRSRVNSRSPSVDRSRPPSRAASQASTSRASSVRSSRERTPSPNTMNRNGRGTPEPKPWGGVPRTRSPGIGKTSSQGGTNSPYGVRQASTLAGRRTPSPQRGRERTPSPGVRRGGAVSGAAPPLPGSRNSAINLRDRGASSSSMMGGSFNDTLRDRKADAARLPPGRSGYPVNDRRANSASSAARSTSASASALVSAGARNAGATGAHGGGGGGGGGSGAENSVHQPGSLFGLAANLGLGGPAAGAESSNFSTDDAEGGCDIDARLQALQSFLKQTKAVGSRYGADNNN